MSTASDTSPRDPFRAPTLAGALFLWLVLLFASCKDTETTPEWSGKTPPNTTPEAPTAPTPAPVAPAIPAAPAPPAEPISEVVSIAPVAEQADNRLRFLSYNLKNYLAMSRYQDGKRIEKFKPDNEIEALVKLVASAKPDVVGVCEIGTEDDLVELQTRLKKAGIDLPHLQHGGGVDETRHLGLLSRLPITAHAPPENLNFSLQGHDFGMSRGILDTTVQAGGQEIRFLGVHLKSKREIPEADQEMIRRNEAYLLRKHVDGIFEAAPEALVVAYGDFNDTRRNTAIRAVQGAYNSPSYLEALTIRDSRGEVWTHYWDYQHVYSRFDYVMVSKNMRKLVEDDECLILDAPEWKEASDHRALLTIFEW